MNRNIANWLKAVTFTGVAGCIGALPLSAADPTAPAPTERTRGDRGDRGTGGTQERRAPMGLDDQQRDLLRQASQKNSEELRKLDEKLRVAQKDLLQTVLSENPAESLVREKAEAVAKIEVEMTMLRAKALGTIAPTLKPEQREQLENSRLGTAMLTGGFGGGQGGFPGQTGFGGQGGQGGPGGAEGFRDRGDRGGPGGPPVDGGENFRDRRGPPGGTDGFRGRGGPGGPGGTGGTGGNDRFQRGGDNTEPRRR